MTSSVTTQKRIKKTSPFFLACAVIVLGAVGVLTVLAPSWAGALSQYTFQGAYDVSE